MLNRRKLFSFLAIAPVATVIGAKAAMDANGNDVAPLMRGDFPPKPGNYGLWFCNSSGRLFQFNDHQWCDISQDVAHDLRSQSLRS